MSPQEYIQAQLEELKNFNPKEIKKENLAEEIFKLLMSKKFRKYSVSPEGNNKIRQAIELNIRNNEPVKIVISSGTYKLWRFKEESPEPDWAELFAMIYYACWLKPITDVYKPGVWFDFFGDDAILELMNNIPEEDTEKYKVVFRGLLKFMQSYLPNNFKYTFTPIGERYVSKEEFLADLNKQVEELKKKGEISLTEGDIEMMRLNIKPREGEKIDFHKNHILHDAYMTVSKKRPYYKTPDKIMICATPFGNGTSIPVGTTKTSVVKFQTGIGALKNKGSSFIEYIYSPSQLEKSKFIWEKVEINGLSGKNFSKIRIFDTI